MRPSNSTDRLANAPASGILAVNRWLGWSPRRVGAFAMALFVFPMLLTVWNMYQRADKVLQQTIRRNLLGISRSVAQVIDPELHGSFKTPDQETSAAYVHQINRMENVKATLDVNSMIKFVYTCTRVNGQVRFVLDTTPTGDADHDGKDDKSHIMEVYEQPSATLLKVLATGIAAVDDVPYQDRWGTFMSAYAPVFNAKREVVAVAGVDIAMTDYLLERSGNRDVAAVIAVGALCLSYLAGLGVASYHRQLQRSVMQFVDASKAATASARSKTDFLAAMSHELRTPMNAVVGMTELLRDTPLDERQKSFLNTIHRSSESLLDTITDILEFSQLDTSGVELHRSPVAPNSLLQEVTTLFTAELEQKKLTLRMDLDPRCDERFMLDSKHVRQVLRHLMSNAVKFTDSGAITIKATPESLASGTPGVHFSVRDTGIGISCEQQKMLFQPFTQADRSTTRRHGGSGIGLAICKRLCEAMDGNIWAESKPGEGSTFNIIIPAAPVVEAASLEDEQQALLLSCDTTTEMLVTQVIEKQGHGVRVVRTMEELEWENRTRPVRWLLLESALITIEHASLLKMLQHHARVILINAEPGKITASHIDAVLSHPVRPADLRRALAI